MEAIRIGGRRHTHAKYLGPNPSWITPPDEANSSPSKLVLWNPHLPDMGWYCHQYSPILSTLAGDDIALAADDKDLDLC